MITPFPFLDVLNVPPQVVYDLIRAGVRCERRMKETYRILGNDSAYLDSSIKIKQGEKLLSFMRIKVAASKIVNKNP
jgi:hypothetical protein